MALTIINPPHSFVRFSEALPEPYCIWGDASFCLPVYADEDVYFQWVIEGEAAEIDSLCTPDASEVEVSIINDCDLTPVLIFIEKPIRYRLSDTQVLYNWTHGLTGFTGFVDIDSCFKIQVKIFELLFCSNCFERIGEDCYTSVVEYGNIEDSFGFKYCYSGNVDGGNIYSDCDPTNIQFVGVSTLSIPYTAMLLDKYGPMPNVQVWIFNESGELTNMGIQVTFDGYPATMINMDFGGPASGIVTIR